MIYQSCDINLGKTLSAKYSATVTCFESFIASEMLERALLEMEEWVPYFPWQI
jgi:hypothetical protein